MKIEIIELNKIPTHMICVGDMIPKVIHEKVEVRFLLNNIFECSCTMPIPKDEEIEKAIIEKLKETL